MRKKFLSKRRGLSREFIQNRSNEICDRFTCLQAYLKAVNVAVYYPFNNEVDTQGLFNKIKESGKNCYFPKVAESGIDFHKIDRLSELETGSFGIQEPGVSAPIADVEDLDILVVPGLCFDHSGSRLGYGKGFYDKALSNVPSSKIYGFCFSFQIIDDVPSEEYDKRVGYLVSEDKLAICKI